MARSVGSPGRAVRSSVREGDLDKAAAKVGVAGEQATREMLSGLGSGFTVYSSLAVPGRDRGDIDHVVVRTGSTRVLIVDSKCWSNAEYKTDRAGRTYRRFTRRGERGNWERYTPGDVDLRHMEELLSKALDRRAHVSTMLAVWPTIAERPDLMDISKYRPRYVDRVTAGLSLRRSVSQLLRRDGPLPRGTHDVLKGLVDAKR